MEMFETGQQMKNGVLLLDYYFDPAETFKLSNSLDTSVLGLLNNANRGTIISTRSRRSSFSGSKQ